MNIIKVECLPLSIFVGYERENDARGVAFDYSAWTEQYGDGVLQLLVQRPGDADPYPVVLTAGEDGTAVWSPSATDTAAKGWVEIQLIFMVGSVVAKTAVLQALVDRSLTAGSTPPDPYETWLETLTELAEQILHTTQPPEIRDGYWYIFDTDTGEYVNSGVKAEGVDGVGITGAQLNADYTLTLSFSDGTSYTTPSIRGAQGEVGPTPQLSVGAVTTGAAGSSAAVEIGGTPEAPVLNFTIPRGDTGEVSEAELQAALLDKADVITDTASGAIASFPDGMAAPVKALMIAVEPEQAGSGDPSPTNNRPISGWSTVPIARAGTNIADSSIFSIDEPDYSAQTYWLGLTVNNGIFTLTRPVGWGGTGFVYIGTFPAGTYSVSFQLVDNAGVAWGAVVRAMRRGTWTELASESLSNSAAPEGYYTFNHALTISEPCDFWLAVGPWITNLAEVKFTNIQVETGATVSSYKEYDGEIYNVDLGQTVYGCTIYPLLGKAVVDRAIVDLGTTSWDYVETGQGRFISSAIQNTAKAPSGNGYKANILCDTYKAITANDVYNGLVGVALNTAPQIWFHDGIHTNADLNDGVASWLNGVQLVYELAEPFEISLTPEEIETLKGTNNFWSDAGDVSVEYRADTKLYIEKKITAAIAAALNS